MPTARPVARSAVARECANEHKVPGRVTDVDRASCGCEDCVRQLLASAGRPIENIVRRSVRGRQIEPDDARQLAEIAIWNSLLDFALARSKRFPFPLFAWQVARDAISKAIAPNTREMRGGGEWPQRLDEPLGNRDTTLGDVQRDPRSPDPYETIAARDDLRQIPQLLDRQQFAAAAKFLVAGGPAPPTLHAARARLTRAGIGPAVTSYGLGSRTNIRPLWPHRCDWCRGPRHSHRVTKREMRYCGYECCQAHHNARRLEARSRIHKTPEPEAAQGT